MESNDNQLGKILSETKEDYIERILSHIETSQKLLEALESAAKRFPSLLQDFGETIALERQCLKDLQEELNVALVS